MVTITCPRIHARSNRKGYRRTNEERKLWREGWEGKDVVVGRAFNHVIEESEAGGVIAGRGWLAGCLIARPGPNRTEAIRFEANSAAIRQDRTL